MKQELIDKAKADYRQFQRIFEGQRFEDIPILVNDYGCTYGAIGYGEDETLCDINFGTICASVGRNDEGNIFVYKDYEIYNESGVPVEECLVSIGYDEH